jgi:hypothetical protein
VEVMVEARIITPLQRPVVVAEVVGAVPEL